MAWVCGQNLDKSIGQKDRNSKLWIYLPKMMRTWAAAKPEKSPQNYVSLIQGEGNWSLFRILKVNTSLTSSARSDWVCALWMPWPLGGGTVPLPTHEPLVLLFARRPESPGRFEGPLGDLRGSDTGELSGLGLSWRFLILSIWHLSRWPGFWGRGPASKGFAPSQTWNTF